MALLPIALGVTRGFSAKPPSPSFASIDEAEFRASIQARDKNTCRFCGFKSGKYQQVHFLNGNKRDYRPENAATICLFCAQCFTLEQVGSMRSGLLIWLPEFGQGALHHLMRAIFVARISPGIMAEAARLAFEALQARREEARYRLGTDDPALLGTALQDYLEDAPYAKRKNKLEGIRLLPLDRRVVREADMEFNQFPQILAYWRSKDGPFSGALPATWADSFQEIAALAA
jgi:intracellular multiplication protein IcmJ